MTDSHTPQQGPSPHPGRPMGPGGMGQPSEGNAVVRIAATVAVVLALASFFGVLATVLVVLALIVIIFLHELGHYLTAKWSGMKVTEFFIGFGPKLWSFRRGETEYGVKGIPAGAYVRIIGMHNLEEVEPAEEHRTYRSKSFPRRLSVAVAGSAMHFLLALVLMWAALVFYGEPRDDAFVVRETAEISEGVASPAQEVGLEPGDEILAIDGEPVEGWEDLTGELRTRPGETITLTVARNSATLDLEVRLASVSDSEAGSVGFLGISPEFPLQPVNPAAAVPEAGADLLRLGWESTKALGSFFSPSNLADYADRVASPAEPSESTSDDGISDEEANRFISPVGFVRIASQAATTGIYEVMLLLVLINVFVGVFNMVPLLPFDGGHVAVATYERIRSRAGRRYHADVAKMLPLTYGVVLVLILMGLSALWLDIADPLENPFDSP